MPWSTGEQLASRHAKKLKGATAGKAKDIANAILRRSGDEGVAIATGIKRAKALRKRGAISNAAYARHVKPASAGDTDDIKSKTSME
jgi:uncharacterized protein YdaT